MKVVVFGATGMVGQGVLRECLLDPDIESVLAIGRSSTGQRHAKLREILHEDLFDLSAIEADLTGLAACFFCLGTSAAGMSEPDYHRVTYELTLAVARTLARLDPAMTFIYISGAGTDSSEKGRSMWARVKGKTENALLALPFKAAYMFRPGYIQPMHGIRSKTGWYRFLYASLGWLYPVIKALAPALATTTEQLGRAMVAAAKHGAPKRVLEGRDINALARALSIGALLLLCSAALVLPSAFRAPSSDDDVTRENDIGFTTVNGTSLTLDMARPSKGDGPFPAVVVLHGGAWREGNKSSNRPLLARYAARGYVAISPQYRFCPKDPFPAQVYDVKAAVRWLRAHHEQYKIDVDHIGATGFSAGGHLALMLGVTGPDDGLEGDVTEGAPSSRVQAVVNYFGPTDLVVTGLPPRTDVLLRDFLGGQVSERPDVARRASPITFVTKDDAPILTFQGTADTMVSVTNAIKLSEAQTREHVAGRVELIVGGGHGDWSKEDWARTEGEAMDFLDRWLKPAKK